MCHFFYFSAAVGSAKSDTLFTRDQMGTILTSKITGQVLTNNLLINCQCDYDWIRVRFKAMEN